MIWYDNRKKGVSMKTVKLEIEDNKIDTFLLVLSSLKEGLVKSYTINNEDELDSQALLYMKTNQFQKNKAYFQGCLNDIESGKSKSLNEEDYKANMSNFVNNLKSKYADN